LFLISFLRKALANKRKDIALDFPFRVCRASKARKGKYISFRRLKGMKAKLALEKLAKENLTF
jgi:hypothetical protein